MEEVIKSMNDFELEVFKKVLPHSSFLSGFNGDGNVGQFHNDNLFKNTDYEDSINQSFIHFTSLQSLTSILNNGYFRISEFNNFEDKNEIHYAKSVFDDDKILKINYQKIDDEKECCFAFSACKVSETTLKNSFMWENYGNKGTGVSIQFKINFDKTCHFLLGKMQYGEDELKPILEIKKLTQEFYNKNKNFRFSHFPLRIIKLLAFHKKEKYREENEVRMLFKVDKLKKYEDHNHDAIYKDITQNNDVRYFFKTFLTERKPVLGIDSIEIFDEYFEHYPTFEIEKIILGSNIKIEQKDQIVQLLYSLKTKHNYKFNVFALNDEIVVVPQIHFK